MIDQYQPKQYIGRVLYPSLSESQTINTVNITTQAFTVKMNICILKVKSARADKNTQQRWYDEYTAVLQ